MVGRGSMVEIIFFGRGGQGAVTAADVLANTAFLEGKYAQAFPSFGMERRGAPVSAFVRFDAQRIVDRSRIVRADYVLVLDPNLLRTATPLKSLKENGTAILNTDRSPEDIQREIGTEGINIFCLDASMISDEVYGKRAIPITNMSMLGAFASVSGSVRLEHVLLAVDKFFSGERAETAKKTARMAYERMEGVKNPC
jgi:2-oxoisovalerate ferredoxin oxidoreductase gamma subunit